MDIWYILFWYLVIGNLIEFGLRPKGKSTLIGVVLWPITVIGLVVMLIGRLLVKLSKLVG